MKVEKFPWLNLIQKYINKWRDSLNESQKSKELNNSESSKPSIIDEAVEIVNIRPTSMAELRSFTFGWKKLILAETLEKILKIIQEHS